MQITEAAPKQAAASDILDAARLTASQNETSLAEASAALRAAATCPVVFGPDVRAVPK